ncbi:MAG: type IVB secretion system protein DotG/IcmE [Gammaproteobacteria bacterium]
MASAMKNLSGLFKNTRTRIIIIFTVLILVIAIVISYISLRSRVSPEASASLASVPGAIQSIPGSINPTEQYAQLQQKENELIAQQALRSGTSAVPTIVRSERLGKDQGPVESQSVGFAGLERLQQQGAQPKDFALDTIRKNGCDAATLKQAKDAGATLQELRAAGCSAAQLADCPSKNQTGYTAEQLREAGFTADELKATGCFTLDQLIKAGFNVPQLAQADYSTCDLKQAGFGAQQLSQAFTPCELRGAGFRGPAIEKTSCAAAGLPEGISIEQLIGLQCRPSELKKARIAGVDAEKMRRITGCPISALKDAGYLAKDLRDAKLTAGQLKRGGFDASALRIAGYDVDQLALAGFFQADLTASGISDNAATQAINKVKKMPEASALDKLRLTGCGDSQALNTARQAGVAAKLIREAIGCEAEQLKDVGYSLEELKDAGYSAGDLRRAGYNAKQLKNVGFSASELCQAGFSAQQLRAAGFTAQQLKDAGFTAKQLKDAGFSAKELRDAGFSAKDLKDAGFTPSELKNAGFSAKELKDAGFSAKDLKDAGFSPAELKDAGFSAKELEDAGFTPKELKDAGFSAKQLEQAGLTPQQLRAAGFTPQQLEQAGLTPQQIAAAGFTPQQLRAAGIAPDGSADAAGDGVGSGLAGQGQSTLPSIAPDVPEFGDSARDRQLQRIIEQQQQRFNEQQSQQQVQKIQSGMQGQAQQLIASWQPPAQTRVQGNEREEQQPGLAAGQAAAGSASTSPADIKAGDIVFAVLTTAVNSDEQGPILAEIVSGKYKGAKVIGSLSPTGDGQRVILTFNRMSVPEFGNTISINAVAIDPNTARTALSSHTNNHYLLRYGSLFASSFLQGLGQAVQQDGTTLTQNLENSFSIQNTTKSTQEQIVVGLGTVGQRWGQQVERIFNKPPTVQVYSGTGMGLLFLGDVSINQTSISAGSTNNSNNAGSGGASTSTASGGSASSTTS